MAPRVASLRQGECASFIFLQPFHRSREKRIFPAALINKDELTRVSSLSFQTPNVNFEQVPLPTQEGPECHSHSQVGWGQVISQRAKQSRFNPVPGTQLMKRYLLNKGCINCSSVAQSCPTLCNP